MVVNSIMMTRIVFVTYKTTRAIEGPEATSTAVVSETLDTISGSKLLLSSS